MDFTFSSLSKSAAEEEAEKKARCDFPREKGDGGKELKTGGGKRGHTWAGTHTRSRALRPSQIPGRGKVV